MEELVRVTLIGLFFGTFGTTLGGIIGIALKSTSKKFLSFILALASGLMMAIVCFDLIPEALEITNISNTMIGILIGIVVMIFCNVIVDKKLKIKTQYNNSINTMLKTGIVVSLGLTIHNFPEGLAIGSGMEASFRLGINLAIAICLHDIPEGISMAVPMKAGGMSKIKIIIYVILSGVTTGIGALVGALMGKVSEVIIGICLSFAAGAMLYIVSGELTPKANNLYRGKLTALGNIIGIILGIFATLN